MAYPVWQPAFVSTLRHQIEMQTPKWGPPDVANLAYQGISGIFDSFSKGQQQTQQARTQREQQAWDREKFGLNYGMQERELALRQQNEANEQAYRNQYLGIQGEQNAINRAKMEAEQRRLDQERATFDQIGREIERLGGQYGPQSGASSPPAGGGGVSSGGASSTSSTSLPTFARGQQVYRGLVERGLPPHLAAGMAGNMKVESNFNPNAVGDNGTAIGLYQARFDRADNIRRIARERGLPVNHPDVQLDAAVDDLKRLHPGVYRQAMASGSPAEAAAILARHWERPAEWALRQSLPERQAWATRLYGGTPGVTPSAGVPTSRERENAGMVTAGVLAGGAPTAPAVPGARTAGPPMPPPRPDAGPPMPPPRPVQVASADPTVAFQSAAGYQPQPLPQQEQPNPTGVRQQVASGVPLFPVPPTMAGGGQPGGMQMPPAVAGGPANPPQPPPPGTPVGGPTVAQQPAPAPAAPPAPPAPQTPPAGPARAPGPDPRLFSLLGQALRTGNPAAISAARTAIEMATQGQNQAKPEIREVGGKLFSVDPVTQRVTPIQVPGQGQPQAETLLQPGDPRRAQMGIPEDNRTWRLTQQANGAIRPEPIANPDVREDPRFQQERALVQDFEGNESVKKYRAMEDAIASLESSFSQGSPAGDFVSVVQLFKAIDPTSTVTGGEMASVNNAGGVPEYLRSLYNRALGQGRFSPEMRADIFNTGRGLLYARRPTAMRQAEAFKRRARRAGLEADEIIDFQPRDWEPAPRDRFPDKTDQPGREPLILQSPGGSIFQRID